MRFLLIRPIEESNALANTLINMGHKAIIDPVLTITPEAHTNIALSPYQALIFTSAAAVKIFQQKYGAVNLKVFTVGQKTALEAKKHGFKEVLNADGDVKKLAKLIKTTLDPHQGPLLYLSADHIAKDINHLLHKDGYQIERAIIYRAEAKTELNEQSKNALKSNKIDYIPFYSARSALIFKEMVVKSNIVDTLNHVTALNLSLNVERQVSDLPWKKVITASHPKERELFNLIGIDL